MSILIRILALLSYSVCFAALAAAEAPAAKVQQGRLADGRAFRTDAEGYRLVDYIAELEVKNEELKRQVIGLENMLDEKDGIPAPTNLKPSEKQSPVCPTDVTSLSAELQAKQKEVAQKNEELEILSAKLKQRPVPAPKDCDYASVQNPLKAQIDLLERELQATKDSLQDKSSDLQAAKAEVENSNLNRKQVAQTQSTLEQELNAAREEIHSLQVAVQMAKQDASLKEEHARLKEDHARALLKSSALETKAEPAVLAVKSSPVVDSSTESEPESDVNTLGEKELAEAKNDFSEKLSKIQKQIGRRKDLIDSLKQRKHHVSIDVKPLVTKDGTSLDQIRNEVKQISLTTNISTLRTKLREIEATLAEDIAVMERLSKL